MPKTMTSLPNPVPNPLDEQIRLGTVARVSLLKSGL